MISVSMFEAKTNLSRYVASVMDGSEPYVVILKNGKPAAKIVPFLDESVKRIGLAEGEIPYLSSLDDFNSIDVAADFLGGGAI